MAKVKKPEYRFTEQTADLVKKTCRLVSETGSLEELYKYTTEIKLPLQHCTTCQKEEPVIGCEKYEVCAVCGKTVTTQLI